MALKSLVRQNIFWRGAFVGSGLLVAILLARVLKAELTGGLYYDIAIFSFYIQIAGISLESGINFYASSRKINATSLGYISIAWTFLISVLAIVIYYLFGRNNIGIKSDVIDISMVVAFISGNLFYSYFSAISFSKLDFKTPNLVGTIVNILVCMAAGTMLTRSSIMGKEVLIMIFLYSFLMKGLMMGVWHFVSSKSTAGTNLFPSNTALKGLFRYSFIACIANSLTFMLNRADYYFVDKYLDTHSLGNYIQVSKLSNMFFLLPAMIASVFFPIIAGASDPLKYIDQIKQSSKAAFLISAFGCLILAASGYWLFPYVFGSDFNNMYQPFLLMIPGIIAYCSLFQMTAYFAGRNMVIKNIIGTILSLLFLVTIDPIVIPLAGTNGAAIVLSLSYLIFSIYMIYEFKKEVERLKLEQI